MSKRYVYTCDRCGKDFEYPISAPSGIRPSIPYEHGIFGMPSSETHYTCPDLCHSCSIVILNHIFNDYTLENEKDWYKRNIKIMTKTGIKWRR